MAKKLLIGPKIHFDWMNGDDWGGDEGYEDDTSGQGGYNISWETWQTEYDFDFNKDGSIDINDYVDWWYYHNEDGDPHYDNGEIIELP